MQFYVFLVYCTVTYTLLYTIQWRAQHTLYSGVHSISLITAPEFLRPLYIKFYNPELREKKMFNCVNE